MSISPPIGHEHWPRTPQGAATSQKAGQVPQPAGMWEKSMVKRPPALQTFLEAIRTDERPPASLRSVSTSLVSTLSRYSPFFES